MSRVLTIVVFAIALTGLTGCGIHAGETGISFSLGAKPTAPLNGVVRSPKANGSKSRASTAI